MPLDESRLERCCNQCGISREVFSKVGGSFAKHQNLCLGKDVNGNPLGRLQYCPICRVPFRTTTDEAAFWHFKSIHGEVITAQKTIRDIYREYCAEDFPDLDFHNSYGAFLTRRNVLRPDVDQTVARLWQQMSDQPIHAQRQYRHVLDLHHEAFTNLFKASPNLFPWSH